MAKQKRRPNPFTAFRDIADTLETKGKGKSVAKDKAPKLPPRKPHKGLKERGFKSPKVGRAQRTSQFSETEKGTVRREGSIGFRDREGRHMSASAGNFAGLRAPSRAISGSKRRSRSQRRR